MDKRTSEIKPMALEPWLMPDYNAKETELVKPVPKDEGASFRKVDKDAGNKQRGAASPVTPQKAKELTQEIQRYLSDIDISVGFEIYDKTGDVIVKVVNRETKELIRQIPPEDLLKVRDKLEELRGVLFARKA